MKVEIVDVEAASMEKTPLERRLIVGDCGFPTSRLRSVALHSVENLT